MVKIHNIMEEQVISHVNELYDQVKAKGAVWLTCDCENCRLDTINYVLNRIPPRYVVSGRGVTHNNAVVLADSQLSIDIDKFALEGMKLVSASKRPYHKSTMDQNIQDASKYPVFNFPTFTGNVYDGSTFEALTDVELVLKLGNENATMIDSGWSNPFKTFPGSNGSFTFWVAPIRAEKEKESKDFVFTIEAKLDGYDPVTYSFDVPIVSEIKDRIQLNSIYSLKTQDIFMFRTDIVNELE
ncbi:MAG: late competence development ComFB family protein [Treponema sp.]|nr:late competence development ComFB family protein [Treponema sp.]